MRMRVTWRAACGLGLVLSGLGVQAASIGTGPFGRAPHIMGVVKAGDAEEVARDFAEPLTRPLTVDIAPLSHPQELMKIGLWLRERQPAMALELRGSCVGACAKSILMSGKVTRIEPGTLIAFGGMTETMARRKDQIDAGDLFIQGNDMSEASRDRFLKQYEGPINQSLAVRALAAQQAPLPPRVKAFLAATTDSWKTVSQRFGADTRFIIRADKHQCMWWVPDAQGLKQLGLDVPDYQPVSVAEAASLLKLPEGFIYVGPALDVLPEQPLCLGQKKNLSFPPLP
ncbi:hypothetical protein [Roseateles sp. LYH14W]|uniref:Uncharacterized protein n=1 Tax=Pelomonas parva TaxID=3299032 RepID=A0ABW7F7V8_9BURK